MNTQVIDFAPDAVGFRDDLFWNTFRLGRVWTDRVKDGDEVFLMTSKKLIVFNRAVVGRIFVGKLRDLAEVHAVRNHNQLGNPLTAGAPDRLMANMTKRYGPHVVFDHKLATVIYLKVLKDK